ncbi:hypothetical protein J4457_04445 [Candidatus Woesearchaeota archaeon]|nr:hypothetical protein [Candidatus Woesearchaeota archaeon]
MANQKNITLSVDETLYDNYRDFCKKKGWLVSRQFEIMMETVLIQNNEKGDRKNEK